MNDHHCMLIDNQLLEDSSAFFLSKCLLSHCTCSAHIRHTDGGLKSMCTEYLNIFTGERKTVPSFPVQLPFFTL